MRSLIPIFPPSIDNNTSITYEDTTMTTKPRNVSLTAGVSLVAVFIIVAVVVFVIIFLIYLRQHGMYTTEPPDTSKRMYMHVSTVICFRLP